MGRLSTRAAVSAVALVLAAPALAVVCHPDAAGTRTLSLHGQVLAYRLTGSAATVALRRNGTCTTFVWHTSTGRLAPGAATCAAVVRGAAVRRSSPHVRIVVAHRPDGLDRLVIRGADGRIAHAWALPAPADVASLHVARGLAAYVARDGSGLYVTRLVDGRTTLVAPIAAGDRPVLGPAGVVFHDNLLKRRPALTPLLKFVPRAALGRELADVAMPLRTPGPIRSLSVDGTRVALVIGGGRCDWVRFWNVTWRSAYQVSEDAGPTCNSLGASGRISTIALGGARAEWVTDVHGRPMVVAADAVGCQEWVLARLADIRAGSYLGGIAAGRGLLAVALGSHRGGRVSTVGVPHDLYRMAPGFPVLGTIRSLSADGSRLAILTDRGIDLRWKNGQSIARIPVAGATSISLAGNMLAATTTAGRLMVYSARTGARMFDRALPAGARNVDLRYGIAVVTSGRSVYGVDVANGRTALLAVAPAPVQAQIGSIGVVYAYSEAGQGTARVIGINDVESALR